MIFYHAQTLLITTLPSSYWLDWSWISYSNCWFDSCSLFHRPVNAISYCLDFHYVFCKGSLQPDFGCRLMNFWTTLIYRLHWGFLLFRHCLILSYRCLVRMSLFLNVAIDFRSVDSMFRSSGQHTLASELLLLGMGSLSLSLAGLWIYQGEATLHPQAEEDGLVLDYFFQCDLFACCLKDLGNHECLGVNYCCFAMSSKHGHFAHRLVVYRKFLQQLPILTDWQQCQ